MIRAQYDERGAVIPETVEISIAEIKKRGWLYGNMNHVPRWAHAAVMKHRQAYELAQHRIEMKQRFPDGRPRGTSEFWRQIEARQPAISEWLHAGEPGHGELSEG